MNYLKEKFYAKIYQFLKYKLFIILTIFCTNVFSNEFIINGNEYSDEENIISIIGEIPEGDVNSKTNYILKKLNNSYLFKSVEVSLNDKKYYINVIEFPAINKIFYTNNERFNNEELDDIIQQLKIYTLSSYNINFLTNELKKIYQSYGYNSIQITTTTEGLDNNSSNLYLNFDEGDITKIKRINIFGNKNYDNSILLSKIKSKTKKITNIFANNNFKLFQLNSDIKRIKNFYKSEGYRDIKVDYYIEYFSNNRVEINIEITEGQRYYFSSFEISNLLDSNDLLKEKLNSYVEESKFSGKEHYSRDTIDTIEENISEILDNDGVQYFEIESFEKIANNNVDLMFKISPTKILYVNQINISGNERTFDYVIRRELEVSEGDGINVAKIKKMKKTLNRLPFFSNVNITETSIDENSIDINIDVEEMQTGTFNVGLSVGTLDGISFVSGLKERNINGSGRSLEFLINTSTDNQAFTLSTTDKLFFNNKINHQYSTKYKENDFSKSKSYKLNSFLVDTSFKYLLYENLHHTFGIGYTLKDYKITDTSTVSQSILNSSGESISFNINNQLIFNSLNSYLKPSKGDYLSFTNFIETPSSSHNGFMKNTITAKKYFNRENNIISAQLKLGNIISLNDTEVLSDNKFSLGGRWLRGFDSYGAGPRNSSTDYVGGNNLIVTKLDYSRPITFNEQNPIYFNLFNDYGLVWDNKNSVTSSEESIRASYGFGFSYYSPIGPIGFTWGFPLADENYDIKRMFLFTIGNLN